MSEIPNLPTIRARADAASPPPWLAASHNRRRDGIALVGVFDLDGNGQALAVLAGTDARRRHADAQFIAHARTDVPALCDLAERLLYAAERLDRIRAWHARETGPAGMVGDYCTECDRRWPCDTARMAEGTYEDPP